MCGISGIVNGSVSNIVDNLRHRGPDYNGVRYCGNEVWFGHNRLAVLDLTDAGIEPMQSPRYALTYNGEIYNYKDLMSDEGNDAATLLWYIEKVGLDQALKDINGMYAFALYDKLERKIHLVVDRFAQKPLYYTTVNGDFAFASSQNALLHLKDKWAINAAALQSYWKLGSVMEDSIWACIYKVPAATHIIYDIKSQELGRRVYWSLSYIENAEYKIEELVLDSIRKVAVSDVPIYIFLSGGIDSTLVASQFRGGNAIHLLGPELQYAQRVAKEFSLDLHVVSPVECNPVEAMRDYVTKCGEPTMAGLTPWIVAKEASKLCKVAISANGADELFFGYDRTTQEISDNQLRHIFRCCLPGQWNWNMCVNLDERLSKGRWFELMTYVQHDLNKTLDFASMAHSLEVRNPFLDHRLVECALSIPQERMGRKRILKNMLDRMGFSRQFLDRPKMGFSLYTKIPNLDQLQNEAFNWCVDEGWLKLTVRPNARDLAYLSASAFGFKVWYENYKNIIV